MNLDSCFITHGQRAGQTDDLLTRIERIELILAQLGLGDLNVSQLSDISPNAGVMTNMMAVASNAAGGWTTEGTFSGVALSTLGWRMSDGNEFPIVSMVDGVLQFGFNRDGTVGGIKSEEWNAAYEFALENDEQDYMHYSNINDEGRGITVEDFTNTAQITSFEFHVTRSGLYLVNTYFSKEYSGLSAGALVSANHQINSINPLSPFNGTFANFFAVAGTLGGAAVSGGATAIGRMDITKETNLMFYLNDASGTDPANYYGMTMVRISD